MPALQFFIRSSFEQIEVERGNTRSRHPVQAFFSANSANFGWCMQFTEDDNSKSDKPITLSPSGVGIGKSIFRKQSSQSKIVIVGVSPSLPRLRAATSLRKINSCSFNSFKMLQLRSKPTFNADTHILLVKILILFFLNVHLMLGPTLKMTSSHGSSRRWQSQMIPHFCRLSPELK